MRFGKLPLLATLVTAVSFASAAQSQNETGRGEGEVRRIDREQNKITLKHGPIAEMKMPAMTMVFRVKDPKLLEAVKEGQEIRFTVVRDAGAFWLESVEAK